MEGQYQEIKSVLFYGSIKKEYESEVKSFLEMLIPQMLMRNYKIVTREGTNCPEDYELIWLDNIVLDIACNTLSKNLYSKDQVLSLLMRTDDKISTHDRIKRYMSSSGRFVVYNELLDNCDAVISIGGREGVYRLGLFATGKKSLFIPLSFANGMSKELAKELCSVLTNHAKIVSNFSMQCSNITEKDISIFLDSLDTIISNRQRELQESKINIKKKIEQQDILNYIMEKNILDIPIMLFIKILPIRFMYTLIAIIITITIIVWNLRPEYDKLFSTKSASTSSHTAITNDK
jgi:hypothetical protein